MPKGVIYELGGLTREQLALGAAVAGEAPPSTLDEAVDNAAPTGTRVHRSPPWCSRRSCTAPAWARPGAMLIGGTTVALTSATASTPTSCWRNRANRVQMRDRRRRVRHADGPTPSTTARADGEPYGPVVARSSCRPAPCCRPRSKEALIEHVPRLMVVDTLGSRGGPIGQVDPTARRGEATTAKFKLGRARRSSTEDGDEIAAGSGESRAVSPSAARHPARLLQGSREDGGDVPEIDGVRYSIPGDWGHRRGRRHRSSCSAGAAVHQHRRGEGLPRRGRGGAQAPPRGRRRGRGRRRRRAFGEVIDRGRLRPARDVRRAELDRHVAASSRGYKAPQAFVIVDTVAARPERQGRLRRRPRPRASAVTRGRPRRSD